MRPKTFTLLKQCMLLPLLLLYTYVYSTSPLDNGQRPQVLIDFNQCAAFNEGSNFSYHEFVGEELNYAGCGQVELAHPGIVYRTHNTSNPHSCTAGADGILGMCIDALPSCTYQPGSSKSIRFNVKVTPGPSGIGTLDSISFFAKAPEEYSTFLGESGPNNYPTRFGIRIIKNDIEIYRSADLLTSREWNLESFDFVGHSEFFVREEAIFRFEILPYCPVGNGENKVIWDIDELAIYGGCNEIYGGRISTSDDTSVCYTDASSWEKNFAVIYDSGDFSNWLVTDSQGQIVSVSSVGSINFENYADGEFEVYHITYQDQNNGVLIGNNISSISGCFSLSNSIKVNVTNLRGGTLRTTRGDTELLICGNSNSQNVVAAFVLGNSGRFTDYLLLDRNDIILDNTQGPNFNFSSLPEGIYSVIAVSHDGDFSNNVIGAPFANIEGCFALSTDIRITKELVEAGSIDVNGQTSLSFCVDGAVSITPRPSGISGSNFRWIISDENGRILDVISSLPISLERYNRSNLELRLVAYGNNFENLERGQNISELSGCFDLSNAIDIEIMIVDAGSIIFNNNETVAAVCVDDGLDERIMVDLAGNIGTSQWLVLDEDGTILAINSDNLFNFEGVDPGTCYIRHLSTNGPISNLRVGNNINELSGCLDISNELAVERRVRFDCFGGCMVDGGVLRNVPQEFCIGDMQVNLLSGEAINTEGNLQQFIVTNENGNIISVVPSLPLNISNFGVGDYQLYHIASFDQVPLSLSLNVGNIDHDCFDLSDPVDFTIRENMAGLISEASGQDTIELCVGRGMSEVLSFSSSGQAANIQYIITDDQGTILEISNTGEIDFEDAPAGICRVYALSFTTESGVSIGENFSQIDFEGCVQLTPNFIQIVRADEGIICGEFPCEVQAGVISLSENFFCVGDGTSDQLDVTITGASANWTQLILTDADSNVIDLPTMLPLELDGAEPGTCILWNLAADNAILLSNGMHISTIVDSCFMLSEGAEFVRVQNFGGEVSLSDGSTRVEICVGDTLADVFTFNTTGIGQNYQYIITDENNIIITLPTGNEVNFNTAPPGTCRVWGVAHNSLFTLNEGDSLEVIERPRACFDYSRNFIEIVRSDDPSICGEECLVEAGVVNLVEKTYCVGNGEADLVEGSILGSAGAFSQIIVTDADSNIIALQPELPFDVDGAGGGNCIIWNFVSNESVTIPLDINISELDFECFDVSDGSLITRTENFGGELALTTGGDMITICVGDTISDNLIFTTNGTGVNYRYIITSATNIIIRALEPGIDAFDFNEAPVGTCRVWGLAYLNDIELITGTELNLPSDPNNCTDLSINFIEVVREDCGETECLVESGVISLANNFYCVGDGEEDLVQGSISGELGAVSQLIVTNDAGFIVSLPDSFPFDVDDAAEGTCIIYNLVSEEQIQLMTGMLVTDISSECFDLSEGVSITRVFNNGGEVSLSSGESTIDFCVSDTFPDNLIMTTSGNGGFYDYIITDDNDVILALPDGNTLDFTDAPVGVCRVWGLASSVENEFEVGDTLQVTDIDGQCVDLSSNFVTVNRVDSGNACNACLAALDNCTGNELAFIFNEVDVIEGTNVCIPLLVENFTEVVTLQGGLMWDPSVLMFTGTQNYALPGMNPIASFSVDTLGGMSSFLWTDSSGGGNAQTLTDGSTLFEFCFDVIGDVDANSILKVFDFPSAIIQVSDVNGTILDYCQDDGCATVIELSNDVTFIAQQITTEDTFACVDITVENFIDISSAQLTLQWDSTFMCLDSVINQNQSAGIFSSSFNANDGADVLRFSWAVLTPTLTNGTRIFTVCFDIKDGNCDNSSALNFVDGNVPIEVADVNGTIVPFALVAGSVTQDCMIENRPQLGEDIDFNLYPNPASESVRIEIREVPDANVNIQLYNGFGKLVTQHQSSKLLRTEDLQLANLPNGIYYLRLQSGEKEKTKKLLIID